MTYLISVFSVYTKLETLSINILIAVASDFESAIRAGSLAGGWWMSSEGVWLYGTVKFNRFYMPGERFKFCVNRKN